jgi:hypothetical protein
MKKKILKKIPSTLNIGFFHNFSYLVPVLNQVKKMEKKSKKKVFLLIYPGLKSEFLGPKTFKKNFIYAFKTPDK